MIRCEQNNRILNLVSAAMLVLATLYSFMTVFFGLDFRDTFYFGCKFVYGDSIDVFLPAVQGAYMALFKLFGGKVLAFRIFNWLLCFAACLLLYFYLEKSERFSKAEKLLSLAIAVLSIPWTSINVLNGNAFTILGIIGLFVSMAFYYERRGKGWLIGVVAFLVLCMMARFPNVVVLVVLFLAIPLLFNNTKDRLYMVAAVLLSVSIYVVVNAILFGGVRVFIGELKTAFLFSSELTSVNHSLNYLFSEYLHTLKDMVSDIKYLSLVVAIPVGSYLLKGNNKKSGYANVLIFTCALLLFVYFRVEVVSDVVNYFLLVLFYSLIFILVFITMVVSLLKKDWVAFGWSVLPVLLSVCAAAGSDSGLILMGGPLGIFCPYIILIAIEKIESLDDKKIPILFLSFFGLSFGAFFYVREGMIFVGIGTIVLLLLWLAFLKEEKLPNQISHIMINREMGGSCVMASVICTILICICLFVYAKMNRTFWDKPVYALNCQHDEKVLKGVLTNTESRDFVNQVMRDYRNISNGKVVFYGTNSMIFSYLTCSGLVLGTDFMQDDNIYNIKALERVVDSTTVLFLCPRNPVVGDFSIDNYPKLDSMLTTKGWQVDRKGDYAIYFAPEIIQ